MPDDDEIGSPLPSMINKLFSESSMRNFSNFGQFKQIGGSLSIPLPIVNSLSDLHSPIILLLTSFTLFGILKDTSLLH